MRLFFYRGSQVNSQRLGIILRHFLKDSFPKDELFKNSVFQHYHQHSLISDSLVPVLSASLHSLHQRDLS